MKVPTPASGQIDPEESVEEPRQLLQFLRYLASGMTAAACNFGSRFLFSPLMPFEVAVAMAYLVGMVVGFILMRLYAFPRSSRPIKKQIFGYLAVNALGILQAVAVSSLMLRWVFPAVTTEASALDAWAHFIGIAVPTISSYFGHKFLTFKC